MNKGIICHAKTCKMNIDTTCLWETVTLGENGECLDYEEDIINYNE